MTFLFHCVLHIVVLYNVVGPDIMGLPCCGAAQCCTDSPGHITVGVDCNEPTLTDLDLHMETLQVNIEEHESDLQIEALQATDLNLQMEVV